MMADSALLQVLHDPALYPERMMVVEGHII
jgi:hypothetical protein